MEHSFMQSSSHVRDCLYGITKKGGYFGRDKSQAYKNTEVCLVEGEIIGTVLIPFL